MTVTHIIGDGRSISFFTGNHGPDILGCIETHPSLKDTIYCKTGEPCSGGIYFNVPGNESITRPKWNVESLDPLTLSPSVLCTLCGNHGFIRNGKWVGA